MNILRNLALLFALVGTQIGFASSQYSDGSECSAASVSAKDSKEESIDTDKPQAKKARLDSIERHVDRRPLAVISADYDGCWDILFPAMEKYITAAGAASQLERLRAPLLAKIAQIEEIHSHVELYVGSARQSKSLDEENKIRSQIRNRMVFGQYECLCLEDYPKLAHKRGWKIKKLLLADVDCHVPFGTSWNDPRLRMTARSDEKTKEDLLQHQVFQVARDYPLESGIAVDFYFFDDRSKDILPRVLSCLKEGKLRVPKNIRFHVIKYDWMDIYEEKKGYKELS